MKISRLLVRTLREVPSSAELPSHIYLLRGGYIKQMASGLYSILPLGKRVLNKIERIIAEEMDAVEGQEVDLPLAQPAELWQESGRYQAIGSELLRFKDRAQHDMVLAMTHEEAITDLARAVLSSYKQLPFMIYQFKLKFRDEPRSRGGLVRVREFIMKDAYSFHRNEADLDAYYERVYAAYVRIFRRVGIEPVVVKSDTGIMGGKLAHEFMLATPHGEDCLIISEDGSYAANQEIAEFDRQAVKGDPLPLEKIATPGQKTIEEVSRFLRAEARDTMKAVLFEVPPSASTGEEAAYPGAASPKKSRLVLVLLRGDLEVSETKVKNALKVPLLLPAEDGFIRGFGLVPGYASAVGIAKAENLDILVDASVAEGANFIAGANEEGFHLRNANFGRDFEGRTGDFAQAAAGHLAPGGKGRLQAIRGIEIGNIFKLGTKFSQSMNCTFLDESGKASPPVMGCYGIGVGRLMAAAVENSHDENGPLWPYAIAPYQVHLLNIGKEPEVLEACEALYRNLQAEGFEVLYDDRDERPGVKFKDADLFGLPLRLALSKKTLAEGSCEWKPRRDKDFVKVPVTEVLPRLRDFAAASSPRL